MKHEPLTMDEVHACFPTLSDDDIRSLLEQAPQTKVL